MTNQVVFNLIMSEYQDLHQKFEYAMKETQVVRPVKQTIFTFSPTDVNYYLITEFLNKAIIEVRRGKITIERPVIITPASMFGNYFEGFDKEQMEYMEMMVKQLSLRGLQYKYKNVTDNVDLISGSFDAILDRINNEIDKDEFNRATVVKGVPDMWSVSLMKCVVEIIAKSFPGNVKELEERGWFNV